jgi:6-hydroxynicotinate 3-monooxygenase
MSGGPRIAIAGGGLGGATAAILLQQAGHDVVVYEQAPRLARIGAGIGLGPNVLRVMKHIGTYDRMMATGIVAERRLSREWDTGRILFDRSAQGWAEKFGLPNLTMHRGDMLSILASMLAPNTIQFGKQLVDIRTRHAGTQLVFTDGTEADADIIIGADGVNSKVREILLGPQAPTYTGFVAYRSIYPVSLLGDFRVSSDSAKWWSDERHPANEDRHFIIYYLTCARDEIYFVTGSPDPNWPGGVSSLPADLADIKKCYDGFHPEVQRVIDACPQASKWPLLERNPLPLWSRDNIVLLGDACHPMKPHMGQGAGMAIEDAAVLVRCIQAAGDNFNYAAAFQLYRINRIERTSRVQKESHENTWMKYPSDPSWVYAYDAINIPLLVEDAANDIPHQTSLASA